MFSLFKNTISAGVVAASGLAGLFAPAQVASGQSYPCVDSSGNQVGPVDPLHGVANTPVRMTWLLENVLGYPIGSGAGYWDFPVSVFGTSGVSFTPAAGLSMTFVQNASNPNRFDFTWVLPQPMDSLGILRLGDFDLTANGAGTSMFSYVAEYDNPAHGIFTPGGDTRIVSGFVGEIRFDVAPAPAPGTLGLLGLAGVVAARRRR